MEENKERIDLEKLVVTKEEIDTLVSGERVIIKWGTTAAGGKIKSYRIELIPAFINTL